MKSLAYCLLLLSVLAATVQLMLQWLELPERVASHFGAGGKPDGFMSKDGWAVTTLCLILGLPAFWVAMAKISQFVPASLVNIPNKNYWLDPDRRQRTLNDLETILIWIAFLTELFFIGLFQLTYHANEHRTHLSTGGVGLLTAIYLLSLGVICTFLVSRFRLPKSAQE